MPPKTQKKKTKKKTIQYKPTRIKHKKTTYKKTRQVGPKEFVKLVNIAESQIEKGRTIPDERLYQIIALSQKYPEIQLPKQLIQDLGYQQIGKNQRLNVQENKNMGDQNQLNWENVQNEDNNNNIDQREEGIQGENEMNLENIDNQELNNVYHDQEYNADMEDLREQEEDIHLHHDPQIAKKESWLNRLGFMNLEDVQKDITYDSIIGNRKDLNSALDYYEWDKSLENKNAQAVLYNLQGTLGPQGSDGFVYKHLEAENWEFNGSNLPMNYAPIYEIKGTLPEYGSFLNQREPVYNLFSTKTVFKESK